MKLKSIFQIGFIFSLISIISFSCENMEDTYREFYEMGETVYIGKADSIKTRPGRNRLELSWLLKSDPKVHSYKIFWNLKKDSIEGMVTKTAGVDTVRVIIDNMEESVHHFEIFMFDNLGNTSIPSRGIGRVYGEKYQNALLQRPYKSITREDNKIIFEWLEAEETTVHVEMQYMDNEDKLITHKVLNNAILDTLINVPVDWQVKYRTAFLPEPSAIDTFYTEYTTLLPTPSITSITETFFYGSTVIIEGLNFSPNADDNIVKFGAIKATVTDATSTTLKVITPDLGNATSADVTVTRHNEVSNTKTIYVDVDQNMIATHSWASNTIKSGISYKTGELALFGSDLRRINILDITLNESNKIGIGFSTSNKSSVAMCNDYGAVGGINAGYFPMSGAVDKDPYVRINGDEVQLGNVGTVSQRFVNSALTIHNNVAKVRHIQGSGNLNLIAAKIPFSEADNVIVCGPILFIDHNHITPDDNPHNTSSTARTGLGVSADGKRVIMVTVDAGNGSSGVTIPQLGLILQALGAVDAMSFDGGGSTTMFAQGLGNNGLVNLPSGGVQRAVRSVIYVK